MGTWERLEATKKPTQRERIRGFMQFVEGANVEGTLEEVRIKDTGKGFFVIRATKSSTVSVQDEDSKTGLGVAEIGELIGVRKCGATKCLSRLPLGTMVSITYLELADKLGYDPITQTMVTNKAHFIDISVFKEND